MLVQLLYGLQQRTRDGAITDAASAYQEASNPAEKYKDLLVSADDAQRNVARTSVDMASAIGTAFEDAALRAESGARRDGTAPPRAAPTPTLTGSTT